MATNTRMFIFVRPLQREGGQKPDTPPRMAAADPDAACPGRYCGRLAPGGACGACPWGWRADGPGATCAPCLAPLAAGPALFVVDLSLALYLSLALTRSLSLSISLSLSFTLALSISLSLSLSLNLSLSLWLCLYL